MRTILKQIKQLLTTVVFMIIFVPIIGAQVKHHRSAQKKEATPSTQFTEFNRLLTQANATFTFPKEFREIKAPNDDDFSFDYAMELPDEEFEIWFQVKSEQENLACYENTQNAQASQATNPDSLYNEIGTANATAFTGDKNYFVRSIPPEVLSRYNADAGKSYLLTLLDLPATKHYKYALLITLQKNHTGTIMAICFTNEKNPEFFKNIKKASNCLKFKS